MATLDKTMTPNSVARLVRNEMILPIAFVLAFVAISVEPSILAMGPIAALVGAGVLIVLIVAVSIRVAHHAEVLARRFGDPYGTMILTLSAVLVEVIVLVILMRSSTSPTLARDTIYAAVMLDLNGILGLAALLGGIRFGEQSYNDNSGKTYGVMILTAMSISMVVPEFVPREDWSAYSAFTIGAMAILYWVFLRNQVGVHSYFFSYAYPKGQPIEPLEAESSQPLATTIVLLIAGIALIGFLAEVMSGYLNEGLETLGAPTALAALVVASISAAPEILTALRAALANRMQAVINIALGASLSTVILTVPVVEAIALFTGQPIIMAMSPVQTVMVFVTLIAAAINLNDGETNAIEGMTHFVLFGTFIMLSCLGI